MRNRPFADTGPAPRLALPRDYAHLQPAGEDRSRPGRRHPWADSNGGAAAQRGVAQPAEKAVASDYRSRGRVGVTIASSQRFPELNTNKQSFFGAA